jgi:DNA-directed RNA polymerase subunit RPC12/RpoP
VYINKVFAGLEPVVLFMHNPHTKTLALERRGGYNVKIPDEYICNLCGYVFLDGEVPENFCPNCGSSMVAKEMTYDEYLDEEAFVSMKILNLTQ